MTFPRWWSGACRGFCIITVIIQTVHCTHKRQKEVEVDRCFLPLDNESNQNANSGNTKYETKRRTAHKKFSHKVATLHGLTWIEQILSQVALRCIFQLWSQSESTVHWEFHIPCAKSLKKYWLNPRRWLVFLLMLTQSQSYFCLPHRHWYPLPRTITTLFWKEWLHIHSWLYCTALVTIQKFLFTNTSSWVSISK